MSKRPSASFNDPGYFYNQRRLLKLFTFSSAALVIGMLASIWQDFDRDWKDEQRAETRFEAARFALEDMILRTMTVKERKQIRKMRAAANEQVARNKEKLADLRGGLPAARGGFKDADMRYKAQKQFTGKAEYLANEAHSPAEKKNWQRKLREERDKEHRLRDASQVAKEKLDDLLAREKKLVQGIDDVVAAQRKDPRLKKMAILRSNIEKKRDYNRLREVPLLDFLAPPTKVEQIVLDNLVDNYEFSMPKKVDRCGTCHVGAMRQGFSRELWPVEILEKGYEPDIENPLTDKDRRFEQAAYNFVYALVDSVTPKVAKDSKFQREDSLRRRTEIHHAVLKLMFRNYDLESGEIGVRKGQYGLKKETKVWRRWKWTEKEGKDGETTGEWARVKKGGLTVGELYLALLKRMKRHWRTHPHFDDMVGDASPHPYEKFGCTSCHNGRGWSVDFGFAYHMPDRKKIGGWMTTQWAEESGWHTPPGTHESLEDAMQRGNPGQVVDVGWTLDHETGHRWEKELGWTHEKTHHWSWPQHPLSLVQSSCLKCHKEGLYETPAPEYAATHLGQPDPKTPSLDGWDWHSQAVGYDIEEDKAGEYVSRIFISKKPETYRPRNLERGMDNFLRFGCYACHKLDPARYPFMKHVRTRVAPPLDEVATKTSRDFLLKWVRNPKDFRKGTRMPVFWGLSNNSHDFRYRFAGGGRSRAQREAGEQAEGAHDLVDGKAWADAEIFAIVEWILDESKGRARKWPAVDLSKGDRVRGAQIVVADSKTSEGQAKACIACHDITMPADLKELQPDRATMAAWSARNPTASGGWKARMSRRQGPDLTGLGSKVDPAWLVGWLKNPSGYWHDTSMPDLRLTDQEVLDVAAFLMSLRNEKFDALPEVSRNDLIIQRMAEELKVAEQSEATSAAVVAVAGWDPRKRTLYVGRKLVKHYGCFGCHQIERYKDATPIGTELTEWGSKLIERLEFLHAPIDHKRFDFAYTKMINPRIYDFGVARADRPLERLRMPRFGFAPEEARDLSVFMVALVNDPIPEPSQFTPNVRQAEIIRGRQVVRRFNCQGCHMIEGKGGDIWRVVEGASGRPPDLLGQGRKTQPAWLFKFMKDPAFVLGYSPPGQDRVRPWHSIRMPTFPLSDEDSRAVVRYFAALSGVMADFESEPPDSLAKKGTGYPRRFSVKDADDPDRKVEVTVADRLAETELMFRVYACKSCHSEDPKIPIENRAPNFRHTSNGRLRPDWIQTWLWGPSKLQVGTKMPTFFGNAKPQDARFFKFEGENAAERSAARQILSLRDYILNHYKDE